MGIRRCFQKSVLALGLSGFLACVSATNAHAVPSFGRQTGMSCTACHTVWPELTSFGRSFKLSGYTFSKASKSQPYSPPVAAMFQASATVLQRNNGTLTNGVAPFDNSKDSTTDRYNLPQQASVFYGGRITDHLGALVQATYAGTENHIALDLTDVRYARMTSLGGANFNYGFTLNNGPTVEDLWNSTPTWGFPYASSAVAPTPAASPLIAGGLNAQVGGIGGYAMWHNLVYGGFAVYRSTKSGIARPLGAGTDVTTETDGGVPYWRFALQHDWGSNSAQVGTYGLYARVHPDPKVAGPNDKFTDVGLDGQYQFIASPHIFTIKGTWIHERQDRDGSFSLGLAGNPHSSLDLFKTNANYYYRSDYGTLGGTVGYFLTKSAHDALLYSPNPVDGSRTGSPNSEGFNLQADYLFREKYKLALRYTIYTKFNGSSSDYDGFGRNASDNNTLYALLWLMF